MEEEKRRERRKGVTKTGDKLTDFMTGVDILSPVDSFQ
jgi:hypothetical protein